MPDGQEMYSRISQEAFGSILPLSVPVVFGGVTIYHAYFVSAGWSVHSQLLNKIHFQVDVT